jgi:hypothetical protein|tara:strand:+ start:156 stop:602 length:447 start_codon:yes stop_codon:yes gene_type:complete
MKKVKGQSALEYLMIIAIALGIIVPTAYLFFRYSSESNVEIVDSQITRIGRNIIDAAESVYFSGEGSKITLEINMPKEVSAISILEGRELVFKIDSQISATGETETVFFSSVPIRGDLSSLAGSGLKKVRIIAVGDGNGGFEVSIGKA